MFAIETKGLRKVYGDTIAVEGLDMTVPQGELFSLLGVNGAGKTTTIRMLTGLTRPTAGDAFLCGRSIVTAPNEAKSILAVSPQETAIAPGLTVRENLVLLCGVHGFSAAKRTERIEVVTDMLELSSVWGKRAGKLSGGWQRRISIAMALISEPEILFLDEPTLGLDVLARSALWSVIRSLRGKVTMVLTTHYMEEAEMLSDRVGILKNGSLLLCDTPTNIKARTHTDRLEAAFLRVATSTQP